MFGGRAIIKSKSRLFLFCLASFIAGVFAGNFMIVPPFYLFCLLLVLSLLAIIFGWGLGDDLRRPNWFALILLLGCFVLGWWRYDFSLPDYSDAAKIYHYNSSTVEFFGAVRETDNRSASQRLTVATQDLIIAKSLARPVGGQVLITQPVYPAYQAGDEISAKCFLKPPGLIEDFDYGRYLSRYDIYSVCSFADIRLVRSRLDSPARWFYIFKNYLTRSLNASLAEPEVSLLRGILLGDSHGLPPELSLMFADLGLSHIIAISGDHIAIVAAVLLELLIAAGLSRPKAFWPLAAIVCFYVLLVGAPASAVRAAVMALLVMYAQKIGRGSQAGNVLILAAAGMILINPKILLADVGFQLSFLAIFGLSYISPRLEKYCRRLPDFFRAKEILLATLGAQIATLPLLAFYFGKISPISLIANILILPVIPVLTVWGLANLIAAAVFLPLGQIMGLFSWLLAAYWLNMSKLLHLIPFGYFQINNFGWPLIVIYYLLLICWLKWDRVCRLYRTVV